MTKKQEYHIIRGKALRACCDARFMQRASKMGMGFISPSWAERRRVALKLALWVRKDYYR